MTQHFLLVVNGRRKEDNTCTRLVYACAMDLPANAARRVKLSKEVQQKSRVISLMAKWKFSYEGYDNIHEGRGDIHDVIQRFGPDKPVVIWMKAVPKAVEEGDAKAAHTLLTAAPTQVTKKKRGSTYTVSKHVAGSTTVATYVECWRSTVTRVNGHLRLTNCSTCKKYVEQMKTAVELGIV